MDVSMSPRIKPPGGDLPPATAQLGNDAPLDLITLAADICTQYRREFPDELQRYGEAGNAWCRHDNQHLLNWGVEAVNGYLDMNDEVAWLARVLESRSFPPDRLARSLELGAEVVLDEVGGPSGRQLAGVLTDAAGFVRSHPSFLDQPA